LEHFEEGKIVEMEGICSQFYEIAKKAHIQETSNLMNFLDYDLENHHSEHGNLEIDLKALLKID
jgi:hypothetical protein